MRSDARGDHPSATGLVEQVALAERKLAARRARMRRHWREVQSDVHGIAERGARFMPLVGVAAIALVGFKLARPQADIAAPGARRRGHAGVLAPLVALATTALRIAFSPQGKELWNAWRRRRSPS